MVLGFLSFCGLNRRLWWVGLLVLVCGLWWIVNSVGRLVSWLYMLFI